MTDVYTLVQAVQYEGARIKGVYSDRETAIEAARDAAEIHRYNDGWSEWRNDDPHMVSVGNRDVTFVVKRWEVEGDD
jgi:hypothetical protein